MKMNVRILLDAETGETTWEFWGRGRLLTTTQRYVLVKAAIRAAKRIAGQLGVEIDKWEYYEPATGYKQPLVFMNKIPMN